MSTGGKPVSILGVPEMDRDHASVDRLFVSVAATADERLSALLGKISREIAEHFAREERLMADGRVPLLDCHKAQHRMILGEVREMERVAVLADPKVLRRLMEKVLPQIVAAHVESVDRVAAAYLTGTMDSADFNALRLPSGLAKM